MRNKQKICKEPNCKQEARSRGYCKRHYTQHYRSGDFDEIRKSEYIDRCIVQGCEIKPYGKQPYCHKHYQRIKKHNDPHYKELSMHGLSSLPEYGVWSHMKERCNNPQNKSYKNYGGRGIKVCERWEKSFLYFFQDMGKRPSNKHEIDRIDNDGNYEPDNCRWTTRLSNARNKRNNVLSAADVRKIRQLNNNGKTAYQLHKDFNCSYTNIKDILNNRIWRNV